MKQLSDNWKRVVIKVGSSLIAPNGVGCSTQHLLALADFIHQCHHNNKQVVLVSSGSVAAGAGITGTDLKQRRTIPEKQALAAIGQNQVMQHWQRFFDIPCAQLLLTRSDLESEKRRLNAKNTLGHLFKVNALPIINENDSVVIDELVVGDNDNLAAKVAIMCKADRLIICSDVDGLYDKNPAEHSDAKMLTQINTIDDQIMNYASDTSNPIATGGMTTKLQAAITATNKQIETLIVNGRKAETFEALKASHNPGTLFNAR